MSRRSDFTAQLEPTLRFPEFTGEWQEKRLGEITVNKPSTITAGQLSDSFEGHAVYGASGIAGYVKSFQHEQPYTAVVKDGAGAGRLLWCEGETSVLSTLTVLLPRQGIDTGYLHYVLQGIDFSKYITGSTIPHVYYRDFSKAKLKVPIFEEQQKIATFLAAVDKRVALLERKVQQLGAYKRGVMQQLFSQQLRFTRPDGSHFPAWQEKRLGEVFDYQQPTPYIVRSTEYKDTYKTPVLTAGKTFILGYTNETEGVYTNLPATLFDDFTTAVQWVDFPFKVKSSAVKILKTKAEYNPKIAHELLSRVQFKAENHQRHWISIHQNLSVYMPSLPEQQKIAAFLSALDEKISLTRQQLDKTKQFKKGLLQRMFV